MSMSLLRGKISQVLGPGLIKLVSILRCADSKTGPLVSSASLLLYDFNPTALTSLSSFSVEIRRYTNESFWKAPSRELHLML